MLSKDFLSRKWSYFAATTAVCIQLCKSLAIWLEASAKKPSLDAEMAAAESVTPIDGQQFGS